MKIKWILFLASALTLSAFADDAFLRIQSDAANSGAQIFINGTFKGECPLDVSVEAGRLEIVAVKTVDAEYEQRWSQTIHMGEGAIKRIQVQLSEPVLTDEALVARYEKTKAAAERGTTEAMFKLADLYEQGVGTEINIKRAQQWQIKAEDSREAEIAQTDLSAAKNGDIPAMERLIVRYKNGQGIEKNNKQAEIWKNTIEAEKEQIRLDIARENAELHRKELQKKLDSIDMFEMHRDAFGIPRDESLMGSPGRITVLMAPCSWVFLISDLVCTPKKLTQKKRLIKQLQAHAAAWGNPESMMGKAHTNELDTSSYEAK